MPVLEAIPLENIEGALFIRDNYVNYKILDYTPLRKELTTAGVALHEDPVEEGIQKLNGLIAQIDAQKTRVANIVHQAIENENALEILFKQVQSVYKREYDAKLPQSPVADFPNAPTREAACNSLLSNLKTLMSVIEGSYAQSKIFTKMANNSLLKLDSTNKNISRQITVLQLVNEIDGIARSDKYTFKPTP